MDVSKSAPGGNALRPARSDADVACESLYRADKPNERGTKRSGSTSTGRGLPLPLPLPSDARRDSFISKDAGATALGIVPRPSAERPASAQVQELAGPAAALPPRL